MAGVGPKDPLNCSSLYYPHPHLAIILILEYVIIFIASFIFIVR
jgi:hypothetical protein